MIQRSDRPFLSIWRGDREFTEWRRGERVLWLKEVPEVPQEKLRSLTVTAASYADLALLDMVLWAIGQGHAGHVVANIKGEYHSFSGDNLLATVRSEVTFNDGCTVTMALGEESDLPDGCLQEGDSITVELVLESKALAWVPTKENSGTVTVELPCLLPDERSAVLYGYPKTWDGVWRYPEVAINGVYLKTVQSCLYTSTYPELEGAGTIVSFSTDLINKALLESDDRPLTVEITGLEKGQYSADNYGFKLAWNKINRTITLIVIKNADENVF